MGRTDKLRGEMERGEEAECYGADVGEYLSIELATRFRAVTDVERSPFFRYFVSGVCES